MKQLHFLIDETILEHLKSLPGTVTEHIRQAIWEYLRKIHTESVSTSLSKKEGDKNE